MPVDALLSSFCLANWATYPIVLLSVDRNLRAVAAKSPADAARLQQEERLRMPGVRGAHGCTESGSQRDRSGFGFN